MMFSRYRPGLSELDYPGGDSFGFRKPFILLLHAAAGTTAGVCPKTATGMNFLSSI